MVYVNLIRAASPFTQSGQTADVLKFVTNDAIELAPLTPRQIRMLMGRAPRRLVVSRSEFDSQPTTTWIETLECGHEYISYLLWTALGPVIPSATHRSCVDCKRVESVLLYLATSEIKEPDVWLRDDYRVAYKTVLNAAQGMSDPWVQAFCSYYGRHPKRAIPFWVEREMRRNAEVGPGLTENCSPKKPVQSVRLPQNKKEVA